MSRRKWNLTAVGVLAFLTLAAAIVAGAGAASRARVVTAAETNMERTVTVSGEGRVSLTPDTAYIMLGIDVLNEDLGTAQTDAQTKMDAVIGALKNAGVAEEDIQTSNYSINLERDYNQPAQPILGYRVTHTVNAKVRNLGNAGAAIEAAVNAGANTVQNIWFVLENQAAAMRQARELAVADAKAKAEQLAGLAGTTIGPVTSISEYSGGATPVAATGGPAAVDAMKGASAPTINPGQTEVVLSVQVSYTLN